MLKSLYIKNYALFTETRVSFHAGLNILTGETGAGKSLLVGALGLIMGKRADSSAVFYPDTKCIVEAEFGELSNSLRKKLATFDAFDLDYDNLLMRREISTSGKSRAFINDTPVSLQVVREVSRLLVDLHGQHENQSLLAHDQQMDLLDAYVGNKRLLNRFQEKLGEIQGLHREIESLQEKERKARDQQDFINFQLNEFQEAQVQADEEEQLEQELRLLQNSEEIREALGYSCETLYNREEGSAHQQLSEVIDQLERFSDVGEEYQRLLSQLVDARESIKESTFGLEHMLEAIDSDPERLSYIEERLAVYHNLKLKYKVRTGADLLALYEKLQLEESVYASLSGQILKLQQAASAGEAELIELAQQLESRRKEGIPLLEKKINGLLSEVGFQDAKVELALSRTQVEKGWLHLDEEALRPTSRGINKLSFLIRTNPGLPMGELSQIASGGEISRVMLAIKAALADKSEFPVLIFDEIDTGISGEIANKVGQVMRQLARRFQILSITHLPQIASKGDEHFIIFKEVADGRTSSSVRRLGLDERVYQIARMISGDDPSESAIRNALEMIG